jgi:hypothetical protein
VIARRELARFPMKTDVAGCALSPDGKTAAAIREQEEGNREADDAVGGWPRTSAWPTVAAAPARPHPAEAGPGESPV